MAISKRKCTNLTYLYVNIQHQLCQGNFLKIPYLLVYYDTYIKFTVNRNCLEMIIKKPISVSIWAFFIFIFSPSRQLRNPILH